MPRYYELDKFLAAGTEYEMAPDEFLVIQKVGTDDTSLAMLKIDGRETGEFRDLVAPSHQTSTNMLPLLDLKSLYYVVPQNKKVVFSGTSGKKCRVKGKIGKIATGEVLPANFASRFEAQDTDFVTTLEDSFAFATDEAWAADREVTLLELTPKTIEKYVFDNIVEVSITNLAAALADGQVGIRFYLEGLPLDNLSKANLPLGADAKSMPRPPNTTDEVIPFSLADNPIEVKGDQTFRVTAINISGASLSAATGAAITINLTIVAHYTKAKIA